MKTFQDIAAEHLDCIASVETWHKGTQPPHRGGYVLTGEAELDIIEAATYKGISHEKAFAEVKKAIAAHKRFAVKTEQDIFVKMVRWMDGYGVGYSFTPEKGYIMSIKKAIEVKHLINGWPSPETARIVAI